MSLFLSVVTSFQHCYFKSPHLTSQIPLKVTEWGCFRKSPYPMVIIYIVAHFHIFKAEFSKQNLENTHEKWNWNYSWNEQTSQALEHSLDIFCWVTNLPKTVWLFPEHLSVQVSNLGWAQLDSSSGLSPTWLLLIEWNFESAGPEWFMMFFEGLSFQSSPPQAYSHDGHGITRAAVKQSPKHEDFQVSVYIKDSHGPAQS
jgi:hypothetical protein